MFGPVRYKGKAGYLAETGDFVIPLEFEDLGACRQHRISFLTQGKVGFLDSNGDVAIPPRFEPERFEMPHFSEGLCAVRLNGKVGYIDTAGAWVIEPAFERGWDFRGGRAIVETGGKDAHYCVVDRSGSQRVRLEAAMIPGWQDWPEDWDCFPVFVNDDARSRMVTQWINWQGEVVFAGRYPWMSNWCDEVSGFCPHEDRTDRPWGLVRKTGQVLVPPRYFWLADFVDGLARASRSPKEFGFINAAGQWVIEPKFEQATSFSEGLACVTIQGKKGFINTKGELVIDARFDRQSAFKDGFAQVEYGGRSAVIDRTGRVIWETRAEL